MVMTALVLRAVAAAIDGDDGRWWWRAGGSGAPWQLWRRVSLVGHGRLQGVLVLCVLQGALGSLVP